MIVHPPGGLSQIFHSLPRVNCDNLSPEKDVVGSLPIPPHRAGGALLIGARLETSTKSASEL